MHVRRLSVHMRAQVYAGIHLSIIIPNHAPGKVLGETEEKVIAQQIKPKTSRKYNVIDLDFVSSLALTLEDIQEAQ